VYVSRGAKESQVDGLLSGFADALHNGIHGEGDLDVQGTIEVGITTNSDVLLGFDLLQPIADFWGLGKEIGSSRSE
jgi:hypothetical protein